MDKPDPDPQVERERQALRDSRALLDTLEGEERTRKRSWKGGVVLSIVLVAVVLGGIGVAMWLNRPRSLTPEQAACELKAYNERMARLGEASEAWRKDPSLSPADLKSKYDKYQREARAAAAIRCAQRT